jgi:predicted peroxiredoxin
MRGSPDTAGLSRPRSVSAEHGSPPSPDGPGATLRAMRILYLATSGAADPTRASIPLHLAVNGSLEVGHDVGIVLAGDAAEFVKSELRERLEGVGLPPARELFAKARQHAIPVYV